MARETAAERKARQAQEREDAKRRADIELRAFQDTYPSRMSRLIKEAEATKSANLDVVILSEDPYKSYTAFEEGRIFIRITFPYLEEQWYNDNTRQEFLPIQAEHATQDMVDSVIAAIAEELARQAEERRLLTLRQTALSKLTDEEKKVLRLA